MTTAAPEVGLVIPCSYLWRREFDAGEESGRKVRPAVIVVATQKLAGGKFLVVVTPVTRATPGAERCAIELPKRAKAQIGLDAQRSWVICDEYNAFIWPGVDRGKTPIGRDVFSRLPDALTEAIRREFVEARRRGVLKGVPRDE